MKKDILAKAIRLADKTSIKPHKAIIAKPGAITKKPAAVVLSERLYTRITPAEMKRLKARIGTMFTVSELLRDLVIQYLDNKDDEHGRRSKA